MAWEERNCIAQTRAGTVSTLQIQHNEEQEYPEGWIHRYSFPIRDTKPVEWLFVLLSEESLSANEGETRQESKLIEHTPHAHLSVRCL